MTGAGEAETDPRDQSGRGGVTCGESYCSQDADMSLSCGNNHLNCINNYQLSSYSNIWFPSQARQAGPARPPDLALIMSDDWLRDRKCYIFTKISTAVLTRSVSPSLQQPSLPSQPSSGFSSEEISVGSLNKHRRTLGRAGDAS